MYPERKFSYWEKQTGSGADGAGKFRWLWPAAVFLSAVLIAGGLIWHLAPGYYPDAMARLEQETPVRCYYDGGGSPIHYERTYDFQWRFEVPLSRISPEAVRVMLACEDMQFFHHSGVDYHAILRSIGLNLKSFRIVSGASTITMQLAGLGQKNDRRRTLRAKFIQASQARYLEKHYSKERILAEYLNRIPFGGKIYGIEAAARYYFGKHAADLSLLEASLICGLPQRPNSYRPDRHPDRALTRQKTVLKMMVHHGLVTERQAESMARKGRCCFRDFSRKYDFNEGTRDYDFHYIQCAAREEPNQAGSVNTFFNGNWQILLKESLENQKKKLPGVEDYAAVLLDNQNRRILSLVGTRDFQEENAGQVNAALARRCAGSLLKPFIYAEAIDGGLIVSDSILLDGPVRYGGYSPENYDGRYYGRVRAGDALSMSLNTPVVRLLAGLTPERILSRFRQLGLFPENAGIRGAAEQHGLSLALGTAGYHLLELTGAMAIFPCRGLYQPPVFTERGEAARPGTVQVFAPGTAVMVSSMLRLEPLPGCEIEAAWKTGTSNGNHDAWCIAFTPEYTLGVWFGNKDGLSDAMLVGREAAAPAAAAVLSRLYSQQPRPQWPADSEYFQTVPLCPVTGLTPSDYCPAEAVSGKKVRGVPLRRCRRCIAGGRKAAPLKILSPQPAVYYLKGRKSAGLKLQTGLPRALWYVNGKYLGRISSEKIVDFAPGVYRLTALGEEPSAGVATLRFEVRK